jgi:hypothetical protein
VSFEPADSDAAIIFAVDAAADLLEELSPDSLTPADLSQGVATACDAYQVEASVETGHEVETRLWARGHQYLVYRLRADEDFGYD